MKRCLAGMALVIVICVATPLTADGGDPIMLPNRLATAKVGEWVTYKIPEGFTQKHMVVERIGEGAKAQVKIRVDSILDGEVVDSIELVEIAGEELTEMPDSEEDGVTVSLARKNLQAAGKTVNGYTIEIFQNGKLYQVWEVAPSLPVYGLVGRKTDDGGQTDFEIVDYSGK